MPEAGGWLAAKRRKRVRPADEDGPCAYRRLGSGQSVGVRAKHATFLELEVDLSEVGSQESKTSNPLIPLNIPLDCAS